MFKKLFTTDVTNPTFFGASFQRISPDTKLWVAANNVVMSDNGYQVVPGPVYFSGSPNFGSGGLDTTSSIGTFPRGMHTHRRNNNLQQTYVQLRGTLLVVSGAAGLNIVTPTAGIVNGRGNDETRGFSTIASWASGLANEIFFCDGVNRPCHRTGSGAFRYLTGTTNNFATAEIVRILGSHVLFFATSSRHTFHWSDQDRFDSYTPEANNAAGDLTIYPLRGRISAAEHLGNDIAVYGQNQQFIVFYQGPPFYFGWRKGADEIGAYSKTAVVAVGNQHYGWGVNGIWVSDGLTARFIDGHDQLVGEQSVKEFINKYLNKRQTGKIHGFHDSQRDCIVWWFPCLQPGDFGKDPTALTTEPSVALVYNYARNCWSTYCLPSKRLYATASAPTGVYATPVFISNNLTLEASNTISGATIYPRYWGYTSATHIEGTPMIATLTTGWLDFGDVVTQKEVMEARLNMSFVSGSADFIYSTSQGDVSNGVTNRTIGISSLLHRDRLRLSQSGRLHRFTLQSVGTSDFSFQGISLYGRAGGD